MSLPLFTSATNTIRVLSDRPNQQDELTPAQLKMKFDQHAINYEDYSNNTLIPAIVLELASKTTEAYVNQIASNFLLGVISDNSLTEIKMANEMKKDITGGIASYSSLTSILATIALLQTAIDGCFKPSNYGAIVNANGAFTLNITHANKVIYGGGTVTIPTNSFPGGTQITFVNWDGVFSFVPSSGLLLKSKDSKRSIEGDTSSATLIALDANGWALIGALK